MSSVLADYNKKAEACARLLKLALHVEEGGPISRLTASTVGRLNPLSLMNLILSRNTYVDPSRKGVFWKDEEKFNKNKEEAELIAKYDPEALKDTVVRLGGTDIIDDLFWKKNRGENDPWYKRVGGRTIHNKKTGPITKILGIPGVALNSLVSPVFRSSHYNPVTDTIGEFANETPILQHELGHALDHNTLYGLRPGAEGDGFFKRLGKGLAHDLYNVSYGLMPASTLVQEARANSLSHAALKKVLGENSDKYKEHVKRRWEVLPAGFGSYLGGLTLGMPIQGLALGKGFGMAVAKGEQLEQEEKERQKALELAEREEPALAKAAKAKQHEKKATPAWQTSEGKSESGGLNDKGRASLKAQGHDIKRPQPEGGPRKDSFCARMKGMKAKLTSEETANDPDSRINKALRKWKCGSAAEKLTDILKESRCWKGYEPVPGKKPYSEDSCRPVGEKAKKKEPKAK